MAYEHILYDKDSPVVIITLNRPDALNALSPALELELHAALDEADADSEARAIILTGAGRALLTGMMAFMSEYGIVQRWGAPSQAVHRVTAGSVFHWLLRCRGSLSKGATGMMTKPTFLRIPSKRSKLRGISPIAIAILGWAP